jgi:hypothetical protein
MEEAEQHDLREDLRRLPFERNMGEEELNGLERGKGTGRFLVSRERAENASSSSESSPSPSSFM